MTNVLVAPRNFLHDTTDWKAGALAGALAGVFFLMLEMTLVWAAQGQSFWAPPYRLAATLMGSDVLPSAGALAVFDLKVLAIALLVHFPVAILFGLCGAWLMHRFDWMGGLLMGAGLGLSMYLINVHLMATWVFPWFEMARNWVGVVSHLAFGVVMGLCYIAFRKPHIPFTYLD
ncbi:MAG: hypothetical protein WED11_12575 [Natronospirillum sp.]